MDCEKFDECVMDALYGELEELQLAALRRHVDSCSRCTALWYGFKSTRDRLTLELEEPSATLEQRILDAERAATREAPWYRKTLRGIAWAGSVAMRPQFAMAALFMLVVGSSLLFVRARPGTMGGPVSVTERGNPLPSEANALAEDAQGISAAVPPNDDSIRRSKKQLSDGKDSGFDGVPPGVAAAPKPELLPQPTEGEQDGRKLDCSHEAAQVEASLGWADERAAERQAAELALRECETRLRALPSASAAPQSTSKER